MPTTFLLATCRPNAGTGGKFTRAPGMPPDDAAQGAVKRRFPLGALRKIGMLAP